MEKNNDETIIEDRQNYFLFPQKTLKVYALKISRAKVATCLLQSYMKVTLHFF